MKMAYSLIFCAYYVVANVKYVPRLTGAGFKYKVTPQQWFCSQQEHLNSDISAGFTWVIVLLGHLFIADLHVFSICAWE